MNQNFTADELIALCRTDYEALRKLALSASESELQAMYDTVWHKFGSDAESLMLSAAARRGLQLRELGYNPSTIGSRYL